MTKSAKIVAVASSKLSPALKAKIAASKAGKANAKIAAQADKLVAGMSAAVKADGEKRLAEIKARGKAAIANDRKAGKAAPAKKAGKAIASKKKAAANVKSAKAEQATGVKPETCKGRVLKLAQRKNGVSMEDVVKAGISINLVAARALVGDLRRMGYVLESIGNGTYKA